MEDLIKIFVVDKSGNERELEIPTGINLSLMEVLKGSEYNIAATCGGMALCATCHVEILDGYERLAEPRDAELDMLDTLPHAKRASRLACQIKIDNTLAGLKLRVLEG